MSEAPPERELVLRRRKLLRMKRSAIKTAVKNSLKTSQKLFAAISAWNKIDDRYYKYEDAKEVQEHLLDFLRQMNEDPEPEAYTTSSGGIKVSWHEADTDCWELEISADLSDSHYRCL